MPSLLADSFFERHYFPARLQGLVALSQARSALLGGSHEWAVSAACDGLEILRKSVPAESSPDNEYMQALEAALTSLLAVGQKRSGQETSRETLQLADSAFSQLISSNDHMVTSFLSDYLALLAEFGDAKRIVKVAEKLSATMSALKITNGSSAGLIWLRSTVSAATPRMLVEFGLALRDQGYPVPASQEFMHAIALALIAGDFNGASEAADHLIAMNPKDTDAFCIRGVLRRQLGRLKDARDDFKAAVTPNGPREARLALAQILIELGELREAKDAIAALPTDPSDPFDTGFLCLKGELEIALARRRDLENHAEAARHWQEALKFFNQVLAEEPDHVRGLLSRGVARRSLGMSQEALQDLERVLLINSEDAFAHAWHGAALLDLDRDMEALSAINTALELMDEVPHTDLQEAWMLGLKGQSLLKSHWPNQAIKVLINAFKLDPHDESIAANLLEAYSRSAEWKDLAKYAREMLERPYDDTFKLSVLKSEALAYRKLEDFKSALSVFDRKLPSIPLRDIELDIERGYLFAEIGDFESARDRLKSHNPDKAKALECHGILAWSYQNLEAEDATESARHAQESLGHYEAAAKSVKPDSIDFVWLRKGMANAYLRMGKLEEAHKEYRNVIARCEEHIKSSGASSRTLALIGWCNLCLNEPLAARRCYEAAMDRGVSSLAIEFDYSLASFLADSSNPSFSDEIPEEKYKAALQKSGSLSNLRRIGVLRVALHDLREMLARTAELRNHKALEIGRLLCIEILESLDETPNLKDYNQNIYGFLNVVKDDPFVLVALVRDAIALRIEASLLFQEQKTERAVEMLWSVAEKVRKLDMKVWSIRLWQRLTQLLQESDAARSCHAAFNALQDGIYDLNPEAGRKLVADVTKSVASGTTFDYDSFIGGVYARNPQRAFSEREQITSGMSQSARELFDRTVGGLYQTVAPRNSNQVFVMKDGSPVGELLGSEMITAPALVNQRLRGATRVNLKSISEKAERTLKVNP